MQEDLKQKREQVMSSLTSIRVGKTKLLKMLANLKEMEDRGEPVEKSVIVSLVNSFDSLNEQEEEYIQVIRNIIQQGVVNYAREHGKQKDAEQAEKGETSDPENVEKFIQEVDEIERNAIAASDKHDQLLSTIKERLEKKRLLDQIHKLETEQKGEESGLAEQTELAKLQLQLASEKISVDRAQEIRNRLRQQAFKRGYLHPDGTPVEPKTELQKDPTERVPPLVRPDAKLAESSAESQTEVHDKIQRHIDQIKSRRQRMRDCYAQAQEMIKLNETYANANRRLKDLDTIQKRLQEVALKNAESTNEVEVDDQKTPE